MRFPQVIREFMPAPLGGKDRRTLYLCVAPDFAEHNRKAAREASVLAVEVDVPGAGIP
jgi:hypothetical protein